MLHLIFKKEKISHEVLEEVGKLAISGAIVLCHDDDVRIEYRTQRINEVDLTDAQQADAMRDDWEALRSICEEIDNIPEVYHD